MSKPVWPTQRDFVTWTCATCGLTGQAMIDNQQPWIPDPSKTTAAAAEAQHQKLSPNCRGPITITPLQEQPFPPESLI